MYDLIIPLGLCSYGVILLTVLTRLRVIKVPVKKHKLIGLSGIVGATIHALIVTYYNYFQ